MEFVVNEWLPEYFRPEAQPEQKKQLEFFLIRFMERNDKIFVQEGSGFLRKIYKYAKAYENNSKVYGNISQFIKLIIMDSERCVIIGKGVYLPSPITDKLNEGNYSSDKYLFEAAIKTNTRLIVTTDVKLINQTNNVDAFRVELLAEFVKNY